MFQLSDVNFFLIIRIVYHVYGMVGRIATYIPIDTVPVDLISVGLTQVRPNKNK